MTQERIPDNKQLPRKMEESQPTPHENDKTILVGRSNGEITTMLLADETQVNQEGQRLAYIVEKNQEDGNVYIVGYKSIGEATLSESGQSALADELAIDKLGAEEFKRQAAERAEQMFRIEVAEGLGKEAVEVVVKVVPGDPVVESVVESKEPAEENGEPKLDQLLGEAKLQYDQTNERLADDASQDANRLIRAIEDQVQQFDADVSHLGFLRENTAELRRLTARIESSDYNSDMARKSLRNISEGLYSIASRVQRATQNGVGEILRPIRSLESTLSETTSSLESNDRAFTAAVEQLKQQHEDQETTVSVETSTPDYFAKLESAKGLVEDLSLAPAGVQEQLDSKSQKLRTQMNHIDQILQSPRIDVEELRQIVSAFDSISDNSESLLLGRKLDETLDALRATLQPAN